MQGCFALNKIQAKATSTAIAIRNFSMPSTAHVSPDQIRRGFSKAMSDMYRDEVPLYGALMELVAETNAPPRPTSSRRPPANWV